jgi:hypothetical protein
MQQHEKEFHHLHLVKERRKIFIKPCVVEGGQKCFQIATQP